MVAWDTLVDFSRGGLYCAIRRGRLKWFSDDYFQLKQKSGDTLEYYDLRFGTFKMKASDPDQFVFKFNLYKDAAAHYILKDQGERPRDADFGDVFAALWNRIMGRK